jgi:RHS repeat-associated protein
MEQSSAYNEYDFPAREYGIQGRWPSPDPAGLAAVDPSNPQSWDRYAYVLNDPLTLVDPTGLDCQSTIEGGVVCTPNPISLCPPGGTATGACSGYPFCPTSGCKSDAEQCVAKALKNGGNAAACAGGHAILTVGPNNNYEGSKKQLCDTMSERALWVDILPFGSTLLSGDYSPVTVGKAGAGLAAGQAMDYVAGSPKALRGIRSLTGAPMTATSRFLTFVGWGMTLYSGYHALNAGKDAYQACMAN